MREGAIFPVAWGMPKSLRGVPVSLGNLAWGCQIPYDTGNSGACASSGYQAVFSPPTRPGNEAKKEGITEHMAGLQQVAKNCNFGSYLDTALRDQLVCGLRDTVIQRELLCFQNLTLGKALERARAMEAVAKEAKC